MSARDEIIKRAADLQHAHPSMKLSDAITRAGYEVGASRQVEKAAESPTLREAMDERISALTGVAVWKAGAADVSYGVALRKVLEEHPTLFALRMCSVADLPVAKARDAIREAVTTAESENEAEQYRSWLREL